MRASYLGAAAVMVVACAHGAQSGDANTAARSRTQELSKTVPPDEHEDGGENSIVRRDHPPHEVGQLDTPAPGAAVGPRSPEDLSHISTAAPPPTSAAPTMALQPNTPVDAAPVPPSKPASATVVTAPGRDTRPQAPPKLGDDIARADAELRERVQRALAESSSLSYTARHVQVDVAQQNVTLRGEVRTAHERSELEQIVRKLPGIKELSNQVALINPPTVRPRR